MKAQNESSGIAVHAIAGTHAVQIAMNVAEERRKGLLGFVIERTDASRLEKDRVRWLKGARAFPGIAPPAKGTAEPHTGNVIQDFLWGDYTAKPNTLYSYRVATVYGTPDALQIGPDVTVAVTTENPEAGAHAIHFNRGVAGSQAYSERFGEHRRWYKFVKNKKEIWREFVRPQDIPKRAAYEWLSRGLEEALLKFIRQATSPEYSLRAAVYEFTYIPIIQEFVNALERGVDVKIIHHAKQVKPDKTESPASDPDAEPTKPFVTGNPTAPPDDDKAGGFPDEICRAAKSAIRQVGVVYAESRDLFDRMMIERRDTKISHNKFIVLLKDGKPIQVWTGSTNLTASGIFGQSNVGHVVRDAAVAAKYLEYWNKLQTNPPRKTAKNAAADTGVADWTVTQQPDLTGPPPPGVTTVFSPRRTDAMLQWYADRLADAQSCVCFTAAFTVADPIFKKVMEVRPLPDGSPYLRYLLLESKGAMMRDKFDQMVKVAQNQIAWGDLLGRNAKGDAAHSQRLETLTGLNQNVEFLHTKYLLIDPLSNDPIVITGSANFSKASTVENDENMLIIRGDTCVADIFLTEFLRLFNHFRNRNEANAPDAPANDLAVDDRWTQPHFTAGTPEDSQRRLFIQTVL